LKSGVLTHTCFSPRYFRGLLPDQPQSLLDRRGYSVADNDIERSHLWNPIAGFASATTKTTRLGAVALRRSDSVVR
jgi:hypothetical protein